MPFFDELRGALSAAAGAFFGISEVPCVWVPCLVIVGHPHDLQDIVYSQASALCLVIISYHFPGSNKRVFLAPVKRRDLSRWGPAPPSHRRGASAILPGERLTKLFLHSKLNYTS